MEGGGVGGGMDRNQRGAEMQTGGWFWEYKVALQELWIPQ